MYLLIDLRFLKCKNASYETVKGSIFFFIMETLSQSARAIGTWTLHKVYRFVSDNLRACTVEQKIEWKLKKKK